MKVEGYSGLEQVLDRRDNQTQVVARFTIGPDPKETALAELEVLLPHALANNLLVTVITDPESTPEEHTLLVVLSGLATQLADFASAMTAEKAARAR